MRLRCVPSDDEQFARRAKQLWDRFAGRDPGGPERWVRLAQAELQRDYPHARLRLQDELATLGHEALYAYRDGDPRSS